MNRTSRSNGFWGRLVSALSAMLAIVVLHGSAANAATGVVYYHLDSLGSVVAATDETAQVLWREAYRPFGQRDNAQVSTDDNTPFYTGKPHDDGTGLSYFGARDYEPFVGRFTGIDAVGVIPEDIHSFNRYAYAKNNPYRYIDPDGRWSLGLNALRRDTTLDQAMQMSAGTGLAMQVGAGIVVGTAMAVDTVSDFAVPVKGLTKRGIKELGEAVTKRKGAPDFVVTKDGTAVPVSQSRMRQGFDDAGFPSRSSTKTSEPGVIHTVPTSKGPIDVRTMEGSAHHPRRAVVTTPGTNSPRTPSGGTPQGTKQSRRAASHFEQTP